MYLLKNFALKDWAAFNEVFGMPLRLGKYDPAASPADREALLQAVRHLGSDAAGVISKATEIEFVEAGSQGSKTNPYQAMADFCNREMSKAVLGQTLTTDTTGSTGSYAAAKVHGEVRRDLVEADSQALATTLREQLLRPLVGFNFGWDRPAALVPLQVRRGRGPQDPVGGLPQPGGPGGASQRRAFGGEVRGAIGSGFEFREKAKTAGKAGDSNY